MPTDFTQYPDLAAEKAGGLALIANDEFFAGKENLLKAADPIFLPHEYTEQGKWMDGWETRRSRQAGYDWCIIQLGIPGVIHGFDVWTAFFRGNYPEHCAIEACALDNNPSVEDLLSPSTRWVELVSKSPLQGDSHNLFAVNSAQRWTHLRLNIFPDGGVARLRVHGEAAPDWQALGASGQPVELSGLQNGGRVLLCNDHFFSPKENLILPTQAANMGEGWETRRRREPGNDWLILRLGAPGQIQKIEIDTAFFKGNYPDACSIDGCLLSEEVPDEFLSSRSLAWTQILPPAKLQADHLHSFVHELTHTDQTYSHLRLTIYPDGGISRLHVWGFPSRFAQFNSLPLPQLRAALERCCGASEWVDQMLQYAPYANAQQVLMLAEQIADQLDESDWLEAFSHHPQIGDISALREKFAATADLAGQEQAGSVDADEATLQALAAGNQAYRDKFGFIFIVCATGKTAAEMLGLLQERLNHDRDTEVRLAAAEQRKITRLRLEQLL